MSKVRLLVAAAAAVLITAPAMAQPASTMAPSSATPSGVMWNDPMRNYSAWERYRATWVFYNLDDLEVKRLTAMGLSDTDIRGIANIALRTGLPIDFLVRRMLTGGMPMAHLAQMYGVSANVTAEEIPGYGLVTPVMGLPVVR